MECQYCAKNCTTKYTLKRHLKQFHRDKSRDGSEMDDDRSVSETRKMHNDNMSDSGDDDYLLDEDKREFDGQELTNWRIIMKLSNLKEKLPEKLTSINEL